MANENEPMDFFDEGDLSTGDDTNEVSEEETTDESNADDTEEQYEDGQYAEPVVAPKTYKVRVNHQDMEIPESDALSYIQKGADYDRVKGQVESFKNDPRLQFVEQLAGRHNMSVDQYMSAYDQAQYQDQLNELVDRGIPDDIAAEIIDSRKVRNADADIKRQTQEHERDQAELVDFSKYYEKVNGRMFNPDKDELPHDVWQLVANGTPLKVAYMECLLVDQGMSKAEAAKQQEIENRKLDTRSKAPVKGVGYAGSGTSPKVDKAFIGLFED